jgi:hypothetical protein
MTTNRVPINRPVNTRITPRAIELFKIMEQARGQRHLAIIRCDVNPYGKCKMTCTVCQDWANAHSELHEELHLKPWFWPCLPFEPWPPNSPKFRDWRPSRAEYDLWHALEKARQAARGDAPDTPIQDDSHPTIPPAK